MFRIAKALVYDPDGNVLVLRRSDTHPRYALQADLPGGIIENGESYEGGLARELQEEAGITVVESDVKLTTISKGYSFTPKHLYEIHLPNQPDVVISWEHDKFEWVAPQDLNAALESTDPFVIFVRDHLFGPGSTTRS